MMRLTTTLLVAQVLLAPVRFAASAQATPSAIPDSARVDSLFAEYTRGLSPGLAVAVVRDGKVLYTKGYGYANLEHRVPITPATVFDVASVSKQFAGLAVAMLITEGRIKLTDPIRKHIPELADVGQTVTVDHLLHHTSGYRDWPGTLALAGWRFDDVAVPRDRRCLDDGSPEIAGEHLQPACGLERLAAAAQHRLVMRGFGGVRIDEFALRTEFCFLRIVRQS